MGEDKLVSLGMHEIFPHTRSLGPSPHSTSACTLVVLYFLLSPLQTSHCPWAVLSPVLPLLSASSVCNPLQLQTLEGLWGPGLEQIGPHPQDTSLVGCDVTAGQGSRWAAVPM
jgi:hypothetical protein